MIIVVFTTLWIVLGVAAVLFTVARRGRRSIEPRGVTILKPLAGADEDLEANLESFFRQDHAPIQIVFGVEGDGDPVIPIAERLIARHPDVDAVLIVHGGARAMNPKIRNLLPMLAKAKHDLLLISDSNVRAPRDYVSVAVETLVSGPETGLVTHLFRGIGERAIGAALENVQLNGFVAAGAALPTCAGDAAVIGKSMLFSRRAFESIGGFDSVKDMLAEDFLIGKMFQHAGYAVRIAPTILECRNGALPLDRFFARQLRWSMLRFRLRGVAFALEPLANPLAVAPIACLVLGVPGGIAWALAMTALRDAGQWLVLRGPERIWIPLLLGPVRDAAALATWIATPFARHVRWRGHRVRLGPGTYAYAART
jgi:ceramide glucosyltransferase